MFNADWETAADGEWRVWTTQAVPANGTATVAFGVRFVDGDGNRTVEVAAAPDSVGVVGLPFES